MFLKSKNVKGIYVFYPPEFTCQSNVATLLAKYSIPTQVFRYALGEACDTTFKYK